MANKFNGRKIKAALAAGALSVSVMTCAFGGKEISAARLLEAMSGEKEVVDQAGPFTTQDVNGKEYTEEVFQDKDLTMVNIFTTWCTPCINEIPDLEKLYKEMEEKGVGVVGIVLDAADENGDVYEEAVEKAKILAEKAEVSYPFLIPDETCMNGRLKGIEAVPETFFVDQEGNIVGETYSGSRSFEEWKEIVETELENLKGEE